MTMNKENKMSKTLMVGDLHGEWSDLNNLINHKRPDNIIQLGDWGWWPHFHGKKGLLPRGKIFDQFGVRNVQNNLKTNIYWIPGNHCNWDDLKCLTDYEPVEIQEGITYCPFGTVLEVNGYNILCCGGASSIDKDTRIERTSWWKDEIISQEDMDNLPDCNIDIVISHTIPESFFKYIPIHKLKKRDPSIIALEMILNKYRPRMWFSGHFHHYLKKDVKTSYGYCLWTSLAMPKINQKWWCKLK